jgi:hypothetical protein
MTYVLYGWNSGNSVRKLMICNYVSFVFYWFCGCLAVYMSTRNYILIVAVINCNYGESVAHTSKGFEEIVKFLKRLLPVGH